MHALTQLIRDAHTHIVKITEDSRAVLDRTAELQQEEAGKQVPVIHRYTLEQLADYARTIPLREIAFIREAFTMENMGRIASPGMTGTEKTIVDILQEKNSLQGKE